MPSRPAAKHANDTVVLDETAAPSERKMTITPWNKTSINIILIGETGVGKTALLNLLANVLAGVKLEDFKATHADGNEQGGSSAGSQTNKPIMYRIKCADGHMVNILDTPGLADTRGIDMDKVHKEAIANAIKENIEVIDAVIILANGTLARLGVATDYALNIISGMFPNSIVNNIGFIFTMVADPTNFNFERTSLPVELQKAPLWSVNNPFAQWSKYQQKLNADPPTDEEILEDMLDSVERSYKKTLKLLGDKIFKWLDSTKVQPANTIYDLYLMSTEIEAAIASVIARMYQTEKKQSKLIALKADKATHDQAKKINEKYEEIINRPFFEHESTGDDHNTLCVAGGCYSNCHIGCGVGFTLDRETLGANCIAFSGSAGVGKKRVCNECKHRAEDHQHYRSKWVEKTKTDRQIDQDAKRRYDEAKTDAEKVEVLMGEVRKELAGLENDIIELEKELSDLCDKYNNLALSGTFVGYISSAIRLLKMREETMKKEGATSEALQRMNERIKRLEDKKKVVEDAEKSKKKKRGVVQGLASFVSGFIPAKDSGSPINPQAARLPTTLPEELFSIIIDAARSLLSERASRNLSSCSLVCVYWANRFRPFAYGGRHYIESEKGALRLKDLVTSPCCNRLTPLVKLIGDIRVVVDPTEKRSWHHLLTALVPLIPADKFAKISIWGPAALPQAPFRLVHWGIPSSVSALPTPYRELTLHRLHFASVQQVIQLVRKLPQLEVLDLWDLTWDKDALRENIIPRQQAGSALSHVKVEHCQDASLLLLRLLLVGSARVANPLHMLPPSEQIAIIRLIELIAAATSTQYSRLRSGTFNHCAALSTCPVISRSSITLQMYEPFRVSLHFAHKHTVVSCTVVFTKVTGSNIDLSAIAIHTLWTTLALFPGLRYLIVGLSDVSTVKTLMENHRVLWESLAKQLLYFRFASQRKAGLANAWVAHAYDSGSLEMTGEAWTEVPWYEPNGGEGLESVVSGQTA